MNSRRDPPPRTEKNRWVCRCRPRRPTGALPDVGVGLKAIDAVYRSRRYENLEPTEHFTSTSKVRASRIAHGTFDVAA
jgi:hypothetical protein